MKQGTRVLKDALNAVDPFRLITAALSLTGNRLLIQGESFDLNAFKKVHVLGAGKGVVAFFRGLKERLGRFLSGGIIVSLPEHISTIPQGEVTFLAGSHPVPDESSLAAGRKVQEYIKHSIGDGDLVFFLVTGGASSLLALPRLPLTLPDKIETTTLLLASGASIEEINCVRKHLSALKGGGLAEAIYPARLVSLILSDVIDSPLQDIGSGPSIGDTTTFEEALGILRKYRLEKKVPAAVTALLEKGIAKKIAETPLPDSNHFLRNSHFLLGDNTTALEAARKSAEEQGIPAYILTSTDKGEAAQTAVVYGDLIKEILHGNEYRKTNAKQYPVPPPTPPQPHVAGPPEASFNSLLAREIRANLKHQCNGVLPSRGLLLSGGELTVTLRDKGYERGFERGKGGRNQEFLLALLTELKDETCPFYICSVGTDGIDGPTDAAGAWIDHRTMEKVRRLGLDIEAYLRNNDSYGFFGAVGQLLKTGPTGTNVMDLRLFFIHHR